VPYEYLPEGVTSDVTFRARAGDLDALFVAAADATTNVMAASLDAITPVTSIPVTVEAETLDLLLLRFLEELVFHKDADRLLLRATRVRIKDRDTSHRADAMLAGETIDPARHELAADVKAVTLHGLAVWRDGDEWHAQVTLDV